MHASGITQHHAQGSTRISIQISVSLICNLNEVTQKTAQQESEQSSTEWVQDQIPKRARLSIAASHCFLCHGFAVFNFSSVRLDPDAVLGLHSCATLRVATDSFAAPCNWTEAIAMGEHNGDSDYGETVSVDWFKAAAIKT